MDAAPSVELGPRPDDGISHMLTTGKPEIDLCFPNHEQIYLKHHSTGRGKMKSRSVAVTHVLFLLFLLFVCVWKAGEGEISRRKRITGKEKGNTVT